MKTTLSKLRAFCENDVRRKYRRRGRPTSQGSADVAWFDRRRRVRQTSQGSTDVCPSHRRRSALRAFACAFAHPVLSRTIVSARPPPITFAPRFSTNLPYNNCMQTQHDVPFTYADWLSLEYHQLKWARHIQYPSSPYEAQARGADFDIDDMLYALDAPSSPAFAPVEEEDDPLWQGPDSPERWDEGSDFAFDEEDEAYEEDEEDEDVAYEQHPEGDEAVESEEVDEEDEEEEEDERYEKGVE